MTAAAAIKDFFIIAINIHSKRAEERQRQPGTDDAAPRAQATADPLARIAILQTTGSSSGNDVAPSLHVAQKSCTARNRRVTEFSSGLGPVPKFRFTSDHLPSALPARMRAKLWADSMEAIGSSFAMGIVASRKFHGEVSVLKLGRIQLGSATTISDGAVTVLRSEAKLRQDSDDRIMILVNRGETPMHVRQFDREVKLKSGEMTVLTMDMPSECSTPQSGQSHVILLPREILQRPGRMLEQFSATHLDTHRAAQRLLSQHVQHLLDAEDDLDDLLETASGEYIAQLATGILQTRHPQPAVSQAGKPSTRKPGTRLADIRKQIARCYRSPDLKPATIGKRLGMSGRSIQHVLNQHDTTFSAEVMAMRLEAAFGMLRSGMTDSISDIAFRCGFTDLSTFYRAFRARYGGTPNASRGAKETARR
ncbi:helix-turn-helix domain-containing protein [Bradyrhizobium sp.]|uniref:helix-turn-helix domain-containing protein n=1 Tax=Bradyrhizobium sp. TaxID=376 RepID=UPI0039E5DBDD